MKRNNKNDLLESLSDGHGSLDALDSKLQVRVNSNLIKILKDNKVPISECVRIALSDIAEQLLDGSGSWKQPDFRVFEITRQD